MTPFWARFFFNTGLFFQSLKLKFQVFKIYVHNDNVDFRRG